MQNITITYTGWNNDPNIIGFYRLSTPAGWWMKYYRATMEWQKYAVRYQ